MTPRRSREDVEALGDVTSATSTARIGRLPSLPTSQHLRPALPASTEARLISKIARSGSAELSRSIFCCNRHRPATDTAVLHDRSPPKRNGRSTRRAHQPSRFWRSCRSYCFMRFLFVAEADRRETGRRCVDTRRRVMCR